MRILVTGATGNVGRLVVDHLLAAGATEVRALTASPAKAALPAGVEVVRGYLGRPDTVPAALEGVDRMYLAPLPRTVREVVALARQAGVRQIVDLAGAKGSLWHAVEEAVEESGIAWTHLEAGEFMTNSTTWAGQIRSTGMVCDAYPTAADAPVALEDIAAVAATLLLEDGHAGKAYELTGPQTLTRAELVRIIGRALGRDIPFVELTRERAAERLSKVIGGYAAWYLDRMAQLADQPQPAVPTVEELTGRPGTTFAEWAVKHAGGFR
jgi:uncharacterized protein YbjT (DUF2867 family)